MDPACTQPILGAADSTCDVAARLYWRPITGLAFRLACLALFTALLFLALHQDGRLQSILTMQLSA